MAVLWLSQAKGGKPEVWSITRKTFPALKATAYRDFREIVTHLALWPAIHSNLSDMIFTFNNRSIEFFSLDEESKVRSRKRQHLHIVEADEVSFDIWTQLLIRTKGKVFADWNPSDPFHWLREEVEIKRAQAKGDVKVIVSTYRDNPHLDENERNEIEYLKDVDPELWAVFGEGEYGKLTGTIFKEYKIEDFPNDCDYTYLGIDFGYSHDPCAVILVGKSGNNIYIKQLVYETGLLNEQLVQRIKNLGYSHLLAVADSAEPKSIAELNGKGLNVAKAIKGPDSVRSGIMLVREFNLHIDPGSVNVIRELRAYKWADKKAGVPVDAFNHTLDALRYVVSKFMRTGQAFTIGERVTGATPFQA